MSGTFDDDFHGAGSQRNPRNPRSEPVHDVVEVVAEPVGNVNLPTSNRSGCGTIVMGCGIAFLVVLILSLGLAYWAYRNMDLLASRMSVAAAKTIVNETPLSPEDKAHVIGRIEEIGDRYAKGEIQTEDLGNALEALMEDERVVTAGVAKFVTEQILANAPIDETLREELDLVTQRLARGVIEHKIQPEELKPIFEQLCNETEEGFEIRSDLTKETCQSVLEQGKELADSADIPNEPYAIDIVREIDRVLDEVLEP